MSERAAADRRRRVEVVLWCAPDVPMRRWGPLVARLSEVAEEIRIAPLVE
ncbi:MAG: hypothetical protein J5I93_02670 [Pirellulaceae bacterium]|nr:hypothetical protein [Pirellulaceae bacterium]